MARRIARHRLQTEPGVPMTIRHQRHAIPLHFGFIAGAPFLWVDEADGESTRRYEYAVVSTGDDIPDGMGYIKSATDQTGLTAHLFRGDR